MKKFTVLYCLLFTMTAAAQTGEELLKKVRDKLELVNDYEATGKLKTNVTFIKAPVADIKVYYKKPDKMKIVNEKGISFIPKGSMNINPVKFLAEAGAYQVMDAGKDASTGWRILKLLPSDENAEIVLSTIYIDEKNLLVQKTKNTTRENGTYELELSYGKYASFGLPDKVVFTFNIKDYKLPKGVTFEYDDGTRQQPADSVKNKKGKVEISYYTYQINKGVEEKIFQ